ncbi:MAG: aminoacyl-tRNA hydrolase [Alphaproteobacteria bacterium]
MLLFVGLGNPGPKYRNHRHNIGFMVADEIADRNDFGAEKARFQGLARDGRLGTEKVLLLKPATFMNESGRAVGEAMRFFKLTPGDVTVFYDELDLAEGKVRVKVGGGTAGHNGIRSIAAHIGPDFRRVRLGIGHPGRPEAVSNYVLGDFAKRDLPWRDAVIDECGRSADILAAGDDSGFMNKLALAVQAATQK